MYRECVALPIAVKSIVDPTIQWRQSGPYRLRWGGTIDTDSMRDTRYLVSSRLASYNAARCCGTKQATMLHIGDTKQAQALPIKQPPTTNDKLHIVDSDIMSTIRYETKHVDDTATTLLANQTTRTISTPFPSVVHWHYLMSLSCVSCLLLTRWQLIHMC